MEINWPEDSAKVAVHWLHNPYTAWIILCCGLLLTGTAWYVSNKFVNQAADQRFEVRTAEITQAIKERMHVYEEVLWGGVGFFNAVGTVDRQQWKTYVESIRIHEKWPGIQGLGFSVPVTPDEKQAHTASIQAEGFADYHIKPEGERDLYSAIIFLEPFDWRNQRAFGYDMWSNSMRRQAMARARDTGIASTSGIITLVQETSEDVQRGFLTYVPLYEKGRPLNTIEERRKAFQGWVYAPFRMGDLMTGILGFDSSDIRYEIYDGSIRQESLLYSSSKDSATVDGQFDSKTRSTSMSLQGREWIIRFENIEGDIERAESRQPIMIASAGLVIDLLLFYVITALAFLQKKAEKLAGEMTAELRDSRDNLEKLVEERTVELEQERKNLEVRVSERTLELRQQVFQSERLVAALTDSNDELSQFAYAASHDLQEPLRMVVSFTQLLSEKYHESLDEEGREYLQIASTSAVKMRELITDLLNYAKAGQESERFVNVDCNKTVDAVIEGLSDVIDRQQATVTRTELPVIKGSVVKITSLIQNLVGNALKYSDSERAPVIRIDVEEVGNKWHFSVTDNGIGMKQEYLQKIFKPFRRLHGTDQYSGTGMGLSICQKIVASMGGKIFAESTEGEGSKFVFILPKKMG